MISPEDLYNIIEACIEKGGFTIRDKGLLDSIVHNFLYSSKDPIEIILKIFYDFITLHPLVDGNKRTAVCFLLTALELLGYEPQFTNYELFEIVIGVDTNKLNMDQLKKIILEGLKPSKDL